MAAEHLSHGNVKEGNGEDEGPDDPTLHSLVLFFGRVSGNRLLCRHAGRLFLAACQKGGAVSGLLYGLNNIGAS